MKEVGSIFPLYQENLGKESSSFPSKDRLYYSLCRETFYNIALSLSDTNKTVLIPAYTCQTVITPFEEAGWSCLFYNIQLNLRIDIAHLVSLVEQQHPSLLVVHPYFGMDLNEEESETLLSVREKGVRLVIDLTQCIFSAQHLSFVDYYVGSYRKWFPIPDGGFLLPQEGSTIQQPMEENTPFILRQKDAMYLRGQYFLHGDATTKAISIRLSKSADQVGESNISPHRMSALSCGLMEAEDGQKNQQRRFTNFYYLFDHLRKSEKYQNVCADKRQVTTTPLYFTLYVEERRALQIRLAEQSIYAPVIWPVEDEKVLISEDVRYIYDHLLAIPIDQRYDERDMERVVDVINSF